MRKISDTEFTISLPEGYQMEGEVTKEGIELLEYGRVDWEWLNKARDKVGLVSFEDEEFAKYADEQGYIKADEIVSKYELKSNPIDTRYVFVLDKDASNYTARRLADLLYKYEIKGIIVIGALAEVKEKEVDVSAMEEWAKENGYVKLIADEPTKPDYDIECKCGHTRAGHFKGVCFCRDCNCDDFQPIKLEEQK